MTFCQTASSERQHRAVQTLLELILLFEAEALWEAVETSRAVLERLRDWDLAAAFRLFAEIDRDGAPAMARIGRANRRILEQSAALNYLLGSLAQLSEPFPLLLEN